MHLHFQRVLLAVLACVFVLAGCQSAERTDAFLLLCKSGQVNEVAAAITKGDKVDAANEAGLTGLMVAAAQNRLDVVRQLLAAGADAKAQTRRGTTALMFAVGRGSDAELVKALLDAGSDVNVHDVDDNTPLILAAGDAAGLAEDYALVMDMKTSEPVEDKTNKWVRVAVRQVAQESDQTYVAALMPEDGAIRILPGLNKKNDADLLSLLLAKGADVRANNTGGDTAFMMAAQRQWASAGLAVLAKAKADVNAHDNDGMSALSMAAARGTADAVQAVIDAGANVNAQDSGGRTALIHAASQFDTGTLSALVKAGANINITDEDGNTALILAATKGNVDAVRALLKAGAQVATVNKAGVSALGASTGDMRQLLVKAGGDPKNQAY